MPEPGWCATRTWLRPNIRVTRGHFGNAGSSENLFQILSDVSIADAFNPDEVDYCWCARRCIWLRGRLETLKGLHVRKNSGGGKPRVSACPTLKPPRAKTPSPCPPH